LPERLRRRYALAVKPILQALVRFNLVVATGTAALGLFLSLVFSGDYDVLSLAILSILTWQIYTLDRVIKQPEDKLTMRRSVQELVFMQTQVKLFRRLLVALTLAQVVMLVFRPYALVGVAVGLGGGLMYSLKIPLLGMRVKQIPLFKAVYVPVILVAYCMLTPWVFPSVASHWAVLVMLAVAFSINASLFDLRDADRDRSAGIRTVANVAGKRGLLVGLWPVTLFAAGLPLLWWNTPEVWAAGAMVWTTALSSLRLWRPAPGWYYSVVIDATMLAPLAVWLVRAWV